VIPNGNSGQPIELGQVLKLLDKLDPSSVLFQRCREVADRSIEVQPPIQKPTPPRDSKYLTIGMATHDDYDGCYFSIQSIRMYHPEILDDVEFLVIDNNPAGRTAKALKSLESWIPNYRYVPYGIAQGTAVRDLLFREATGEFVLCMDSHVLFPPGALARLVQYCRDNPLTGDLLQGPLISDALEPIATHFDPKWSHGMYGVWGLDERGKNPESDPFEIPMQGLGVFACRRDSWPGFNPRLAGFGGEEGYVHEKIRRAGGRNLCLPFLRWMHRFERPNGIPYQPSWADRVRNYLLIHREMGVDPQPVVEHFSEFVGKEETTRLVTTVERELSSPFHFFDGIYCINLDRQPERWRAMQRRFERFGIQRRVRRMPAAYTPSNQHIGCALSHRRIIEDAKRQGLRTVLVFEDDAQFAVDAADVLAGSLQELEQHDWQFFYLGGHCWGNPLERVPGCRYLARVKNITCTHAIAYHESVYDAALKAVPESGVDVRNWLRTHAGIDQFYDRALKATRFVTDPIIATQGSILGQESRAFED
jgi:hypothetical protein